MIWKNTLRVPIYKFATTKTETNTLKSDSQFENNNIEKYELIQ